MDIHMLYFFMIPLQFTVGLSVVHLALHVSMLQMFKSGGKAANFRAVMPVSTSGHALGKCHKALKLKSSKETCLHLRPLFLGRTTPNKSVLRLVPP